MKRLRGQNLWWPALGLGLALFLVSAHWGLDGGVLLVWLALLATALLASYAAKAKETLPGLSLGRAVALIVSAGSWALGSLLAASVYNLSWLCSGLLAAGGLAWVAASCGTEPEAEALEPSSGEAARLAAGFGLAFAAAVLGIWLAFRSMVPALGTHLFFMPRSLAGYEGIPSAPFHDAAVLAAPVLFWILALGALAWFYSRKQAWLLPALFAVGFIGKILVASVSGSGLQVLPQQITGVSTAFYTLGSIPHNMGIYSFICHFNEMQAKLNTHGDTHPFGCELYYLFLVRLVGANPWHVALAVSAVAGLGVSAVYQLGREIFGEMRLAFAASLLYLASPANMILNTSGIDSTFSVVFAYGLLLLLQGLRRKSAWLLAAAGILGWFLSLLSLAASYYFLLGIYFLAAEARKGAAWKELGYAALQFAMPALGLHIALWSATAGQFHYWEIFSVARPVQEALTQARPYFLWVWLDGFLFLGYAGLASMGLTLLALGRKLGNPGLGEGFWAASLGLAAMIFIQSLGNGEVQRMDHFLYLLMALWAAKALAGTEDKAWLRNLFLLASLNFVGSLILEALVMDYW